MREHEFTDPVSGRVCWLVITSQPMVRHPGCDRLADVVPVLDAFYCPGCGWNGRVSGAWVADMLAAREAVGVAVEDSIEDPFTGEATVRFRLY